MLHLQDALPALRTLSGWFGANDRERHLFMYFDATQLWHVARGASRVLKPGGFAVLQTTYSAVLRKNFEDDGIATAGARAYFHGQEDHVRTFAETDLLNCIDRSGFALKIASHARLLSQVDPAYFGVNKSQDFILAQKL